MNNYIIDGHEWELEIVSGNNRFAGKATLNEPCFSVRMVFTAQDSYYPTEDSVNEFLIEEIKNILKNASYEHPSINSQKQQVGSICRCAPWKAEGRGA